jgi:hypothetical protein
MSTEKITNIADLDSVLIVPMDIDETGNMDILL